MQEYQSLFFWGFLIVYGVIMYAFSPKARSIGSFFKGEDEGGIKVSPFLLTTSIFISWIFAKSVTNAANLGASYGIDILALYTNSRHRHLPLKAQIWRNRTRAVFN